MATAGRPSLVAFQRFEAVASWLDLLQNIQYKYVFNKGEHHILFYAHLFNQQVIMFVFLLTWGRILFIISHVDSTKYFNNTVYV